MNFIDLPKVLKPRVQVEVAHSRLRTVSMLVTCLPLDASPEKTKHFCHALQCVKMSLSLHILTEILTLTVKLKGKQRQEGGPTEEDLVVS